MKSQRGNSELQPSDEDSNTILLLARLASYDGLLRMGRVVVGIGCVSCHQALDTR